MSEATHIVAIDGPAGAGKSSTAKRVAEVLGYSFLDTGAMYRAATWNAVQQGISLDDGEALAEATRVMQLDVEESPSGQRVLVNGQDVTDAIRTPEITRIIFKLDQNPAVRRHLVALQQRVGAQRPTVAEGRDIGTVVFPKAHCKIYMDASLDERTRRRARQLEEKGGVVDYAALKAEIAERDEKAINRADSPLRPADDAVILDTTQLSFDEVVDAVVRLARQHP